MSTKHISAQDFLKNAASVATYYGFDPLEETVGALPQQKIKLEISKTHSADMLGQALYELARACTACDLGKVHQPLQLYQTQFARDKNKERARASKFGLTVFGIDKSIAEALLLKTSISILEETGVHDMCVHVNSMGDNDSMNKFTREVSQFLRKHISDLPASCRERMREDIFEALHLLFKEEHPLAYESPRPMQFLTDSSRQHFKEVLEFLETSGIPYELTNELVGNRDYYSQTIFEIHEHEKEDAPATRILVRGGRCDDFTKRTLKSKVPTVSALIVRETTAPAVAAWKPPRLRHPKVYFVQIGARAKLLALSIIELLRRARIPLKQALGNDSLTEQLDEAREARVPYALIMGQREALDQTVIVRDMGTHAQDVISIEKLPEHLKLLKI